MNVAGRGRSLMSTLCAPSCLESLKLPARRRRGPTPIRGEPRVRRGTVRVSGDVATRLRCGHPYLFRDALGGRAAAAERRRPGRARRSGGRVRRQGALRSDRRDRGARRDAQSRRRLRRRDRSRGASRRRKRLREQLLPADGSDAYRVIHSEGDGIPGVTVDRYGDHPGRASVLAGDRAAARRALRRAREDVEAARDLRAAALPPADRRRAARAGVAGARRGRARRARGQRGRHQVRRRRDGAARHRAVPRSARRAASRSARYAAGRRVLNLFSYTGAFSVYAAKAGAREIVSVDLAPKAHARARRNLQANGLDESEARVHRRRRVQGAGARWPSASGSST